MEPITYQSRIGKLTVLDPHFGTDDYGKKVAQVKCECGTVKTVLVTNLTHGLTQSCGLCTKRGGARKHRYKPRKRVKPSSRVETVATSQASVVTEGACVRSEE